MNLEQQILERIAVGDGVSADALLIQHCRAESSTRYLEHRQAVKKVLRRLRQAKRIEITESSYYIPLEVQHG
jgi:hypothetical protein